MISLNMQFNSVEQMHVALTHILAGVQPQAPAANLVNDQAQEGPTKAPKPPKAVKPAPTPPASAAAPQEPAQATPAAASPSEPAPLTLEVVRAKMVEVSQAGKSAQVKALIAEVGGAERLTDVSADKYPLLMEKVGAL